MECNSIDKTFDEIVNTALDGDEAVYWSSSHRDDKGYPVLVVAAEPATKGFKLRIGVSVEKSDAQKGIPDVLEASPYIDQFADEWFNINTRFTKLTNGEGLRKAGLQFERYDTGKAYYTCEFSESGMINRIRNEFDV